MTLLRAFASAPRQKRFKKGRSLSKTSHKQHSSHQNPPERASPSARAGLYAVRKTLRYAPMRIGGSPPLEDTERHRQRFAHGLFTELPQLALLDWWWKRDYMMELGYYYHVVFLIHRQKTLFYGEPFLVLDERWQQATDGWGAVETHLVPRESEAGAPMDRRRQ